MRKRLITAMLLLGWMLLVAACSSVPASTPTATPSAAIKIELDANPDPPQIGSVDLIVILTDAANQPIDNAKVSLIISHKDMANMDMFGLSSSMGNGRYTLASDFRMAGNWLVTVEVRGVGPETVRKDFELSLIP